MSHQEKSGACGGGTGTKRKPPDQAPESGAQEPPQAEGRAEAERPIGKTMTGSPRPAASAREAQEPDPAPEKQADGEGEGTTPAGQGEETNPTNPAPAPDEDTAETRVVERRTKEERPTPNDEARNTDAEGATERTRASAPGAHPTATPRPAAKTEPTTRETSDDDDAGNDREPQKPTKIATNTSKPKPSAAGAGAETPAGETGVTERRLGRKRKGKLCLGKKVCEATL